MQGQSLAGRYSQAEGADAADGRQQARARFEATTRSNPQDEQAWLGLAHASDNRDEALDALSQVLALNPDNMEARNLRVALQVRGVRDTIAGTLAGYRESPLRRWGRLLMIPLTVLLLGGLALYIKDPALAWWNENFTFAELAAPTLAAAMLPPTWTSTATPTQTLTPTATNTPLPTSTPVQPTATPIPTRPPVVRVVPQPVKLPPPPPASPTPALVFHQSKFKTDPHGPRCDRTFIQGTVWDDWRLEPQGGTPGVLVRVWVNGTVYATDTSGSHNIYSVTRGYWEVDFPAHEATIGVVAIVNSGGALLSPQYPFTLTGGNCSSPQSVNEIVIDFSH